MENTVEATNLEHMFFIAYDHGIPILWGEFKGRVSDTLYVANFMGRGPGVNVKEGEVLMRLDSYTQEPLGLFRSREELMQAIQEDKEAYARKFPTFKDLRS